MTQTMKAAVLRQFGGAEMFEIRDVAVPSVGPREARVRVHATSINPIDYKIRRGDYVDHVPLPAITGHDVSGVIEEIGSDVTEFAVGDEVYYTPQIFGTQGSYAEKHVANVDLIAHKPKNLSHEEAASMTLVGGTVWEAFVTRAQIQVGETVLVHGGAGGVGSIAIQIAKAMGARVFTTAARRDHDFVSGLGADLAIDYRTEDYIEVVNRATGDFGVDVVFDTIGGDTLTRSPRVLAPMGRVVTLVDIPRPQNLVEAWGRNASYHFVFTRQNRGKLDALTHLLERGQVKPVIGATFPLERISEAHAYLEARSANGLRGKVVITMNGDGDRVS